MHINYVLCFLLTLSVTEGAPWSLFGGPSCKPYHEKGAKGKWSMKIYAHRNCGNEIKTIDATQNLSTNKCYPLDPKTQSFHGIGYGQYQVIWYHNKDCTNQMLASAGGKYKQEAHKAPKSFMVAVPHTNIKGYNSGISFCGQDSSAWHGYSVDDYRTQAMFTNDVCAKVLKKCETTGNKDFACPSQSKFYLSEVITPIEPGDKPYTSKSCVLPNRTMQSWFDSFCKARKGYFCQRFACLPGDAFGADCLSYPCSEPRLYE